MPERGNAGAENALLALIGVFALVFFLQTWTYSPMAALFPRLVSAAVALLVLYMLGMKLLAYRFGSPTEKQEKGPVQSGAAQHGTRRDQALPWYWSLLLLAAFSLILFQIGLEVASLFLMLSFPIMMGYKKRGVLILVSVFFTLGLVLLLKAFLKFPLPSIFWG